MERLKLTAAEVQSGDGSGRVGGGSPQQYLLYASPPGYVNARYSRLFPCRLLNLRAVTCLFFKWLGKREAGCLYVLHAQAGKLSLVTTSWILAAIWLKFVCISQFFFCVKCFIFTHPRHVFVRTFGWNYSWMYSSRPSLLLMYTTYTFRNDPY